MELDHAKHGWRVVCVDNCEPILEIAGAPVVNVDANFLIPADQQGVDMGSWRIGQMHAMYEASKRARPSLVSMAVQPTDPSLRPYRPPDYAEEWRLLRKAWSLARHGQTKLSEKQIAKAAAELYPPEHSIDSLQNWVWRLATFLCNPSYEPLFDAATKAIEPLKDSVLWWDFRQFYKILSVEHGTRYFNVMREFFAAYDEFCQDIFWSPRGYRPGRSPYDIDRF